jgi:hypothetical protein
MMMDKSGDRTPLFFDFLKNYSLFQPTLRQAQRKLGLEQRKEEEILGFI